MTAVVQIKGVEGVRKMLQPWLEPEMSRNMDKATKEGAQVMGKALKAELRPVSKRMARAVRVRRARRERPAYVVGSRRKVAFFWPFVIGGTRDHGPRRASVLAFEGASGFVRTQHVRGVKPNPIVDRVAERYQAQAYAALDRALPKE